MKNLIYLYGSTIAAMVLLSSCYTYAVDEARQKQNLYYLTPTPNTQLFSEKKDAGFSLMRSGGSKFSGVEFQASYLPSTHTGLVTSYSGAWSTGSHDYMSYNQFEIGAGYISNFKEGWHFETYGGFGSGKIDNIHGTGQSTIHLNHIFLQPAIAVSNKDKSFQIALVSRFSGVHFEADTAFDRSIETFSASHIQALYDNPFQVMWEPGVVLRFGWQRFVFQANYSFSTDLTTSKLYGSKSNFSIGGALRFNSATMTQPKKH